MLQEAACDESKCVSWGAGDQWNDSFTCYNDMDYMVCADGFRPHIVEDEPRIFYNNPYIEDFSFYVSYFTCCPPNTMNAVSRQCSNPKTIEFDSDFQGDRNNYIPDGICDDDERKYPRRMKVRLTRSLDGTPEYVYSVVCCDSSLVDTNANYLNETECVRYRNDLYENAFTMNVIGKIGVKSCSFRDDSFPIPSRLHEQPGSNASESNLYQCCKTGTAVEPYVQDRMFQITVFVPLALYVIAAVLSLLLLVALFVPLFLQMKNGSFWRSRRSRRSRNKKPRYSTYNLYLVYLVLFDLIYALFHIVILGRMIHQKHNQNFTNYYVLDVMGGYGMGFLYYSNSAMTYAYISTNMWINVIITYRLLLLIQKSKTAQRTNQPSLRTVNMQVGVVVLLSTGYGVVLYALQEYALRAELADKIETFNRISISTHTLVIVNVVVPILVICGITFWIWWCDILPSVNSQNSVRDKAMRQLVLFFFRIMLVFFIVWIPWLFFALLGTDFDAGKHRMFYQMIAHTIQAAQPILSACLALTKYDVRKYVMDLISLSYCRSKVSNKIRCKKDIFKGHDAVATNTNSNPTERTMQPISGLSHGRFEQSGELQIGNNDESKPHAKSKGVPVKMCIEQDPSTSRGNGDDNGCENEDESDDDSESHALRFSIFGPGRNNVDNATFGIDDQQQVVDEEG